MPAKNILALVQTLSRQPGLRHELRLGPVPDDIEQVLALAGGERGHLERTAEALATDPDRLQQAARFYVQEVLLFQGAEDRRLLGLPPGADAATLKRHYRLLQSWLHPDRANADSGEAIHSARINAAFHRLRHGSAAASMAGATQDEAFVPPTTPVRVRHWVRVEDAPPRRTGGRRLFVAALALVLVGGGLWLTWTPPQRPERGPIASLATPPPPAQGRKASASARFSDTLALPAIANEAIDSPPPDAAITAEGAHAAVQPRSAARPEAEARVVPQQVAATATSEPVAVPVAASVPVASQAVKTTTAIASISAPALPQPDPVQARAPDPEPIPAPDPVRARHAQQRAQALLAWLTSRQAVPPPIWRSGPALDAAESVRRQLADDSSRGQAQILHSQAHWRIEPDTARLQVPVRTSDRGSPRMLRAGLGWRDQEWWVESVTLETITAEPAP